MSTPLEVFCCYARKDQELLAQLKNHLALLEHLGQIRIWSDADIDAGMEWKRELQRHLESANIILLLISPDFMASKYCYSTEMERAIARHDEGSAVVIPILLRPIYWQNAPFARLQMVPTNAQPVTSWADRDSAFEDIVAHIDRVVSKLRTRRAPVEADEPALVGGPPAPLLRNGGSSPSGGRGPFHGRRMFLVPLIGCLLLAMGIGAFRIWGGFFHSPEGTRTATTTTQICPRGLAPPHGTSSYDLAVAQSGMQFGFDAQHTRTNPYEQHLNPGNVKNLKPVWTCLLGSGIDSSPPTVAYGLVYVGSQDHKLYAFDARTEHQVWAASTKDAIDSSPAVANGVVYVGSHDNNLYAFDATTGQQKGVADLGDSSISSPTLADGLIYIGSDNGNLYAFNAPVAGQSNWAPKWVAYTNPASPTKQRGIASSPAVADGLVYASSRDGRLYAFDIATGHQRWVASTKGVIDSSPAVANGVVYVGSHDGNLYAFDARTGQQKWSASTGPIHDSSPAVANNLVYVGSFDNQSLYAFNAATGGQPKWVAPTGDGIYSSPVVANGLVYTGSHDGRLYAFDAATGGQPKWSYVASSNPKKWGLDSSPAVADGFVYIGSQDGRLYAFSLP